MLTQFIMTKNKERYPDTQYVIVSPFVNHSKCYWFRMNEYRNIYKELVCILTSRGNCFSTKQVLVTSKFPKTISLHLDLINSKLSMIYFIPAQAKQKSRVNWLVYILQNEALITFLKALRYHANDWGRIDQTLSKKQVLEKD